MEKTIQSTNDYSIFKKCESNRHVRNMHVKRLVESISADNHLSSVPIVVNKDMEVMDGQHRLEAAKELQIPIWYIVDDSFKVETIAPLNNNTQRWDTEDWLSFWIAKGDENYIRFKRFKEKYGLSSSGMLVWLGEDSKSKHVSYSSFRKGKFKFEISDDVYEALNCYLETVNFLKDHHLNYRKIVKNKYFLKAIKDILTNPLIDLKRFKDRIENYYYRLVQMPNREMYLQSLVDIYNFQMRSDKVEVVKRGQKLDIERQLGQ